MNLNDFKHEVLAHLADDYPIVRAIHVHNATPPTLPIAVHFEDGDVATMDLELSVLDQCGDTRQILAYLYASFEQLARRGAEEVGRKGAYVNYPVPMDPRRSRPAHLRVHPTAAEMLQGGSGSTQAGAP